MVAMIDTHGAWDSEEIVTYEYESSVAADINTVYTYRHKLMDKFVQKILESGATVVKTSIRHKQGTALMPTVVFEFSLSGIPDAMLPSRYVNNRSFNDIVGTLLAVIDAEDDLAKAKQKLDRISF